MLDKKPENRANTFVFVSLIAGKKEVKLMYIYNALW